MNTESIEEPTVVVMGGQYVEKTCEMCGYTKTFDRGVTPWICKCGHDTFESIYPVGTMVECPHCHQQCDYHVAYHYGGTCSNCWKPLPRPVASLPSKSESEQLNPFPAKPTTAPPAHYFAREREEVNGYDVDKSADMITRKRMSRHDIISEQLECGQYYMDGYWLGYDEGVANMQPIIPPSGVGIVDVVVSEPEWNWIQGYMDGFEFVRTAGFQFVMASLT